MEIRCIMKLPGSSIRWHVDIFGMLVGPCAVCQVLDMLGARATQAMRVIVSSKLFCYVILCRSNYPVQFFSRSVLRGTLRM